MPAKSNAAAGVDRAGPDFPLLTMTGFLMQRAGAMLVQAAERELERRGIRLRYFYVLAALESTTPMSQQDLSNLLGLDPGSMVSLVDEMEGNRHVERQRDPADRRRYIVHLTAEGRGVLTRTSALLEHVERRFLGALSADEQRQLGNLLEKALAPSWPALVRCEPQ